MNKFAAILGLAVIGTIAAFLVFNAPSKASFQATGNLQHLFDEWKVKYNKTYGGAENMVRFSIFSANYYQVQVRNQEQSTYTVGLNQFADLTQEEFASIYLGYKAHMKTSSAPATTSNVDVPDSVDWVTKGAVTGVKNQGQCGSCWAFSTTGSLEGLHYLKTGTLTSFSEQQLVDCSGSYGNMGCNGGLMDNAFKYVEKYGIETEQDYPYVGVDQSCKYDKSKVVFTNTGYSDVTHDSVDSLKAAVAQQPTSIAVEADQIAFQFYTGGVITSGCGTSLDHGVLAVGYDSSASTPYWLVKNSWGGSWGLNGYLKIEMGTENSGAGECGIMLSPSYPTEN